MTVFKYMKRNQTIYDPLSYIKSVKKRTEMELLLKNWEISIKELKTMYLNKFVSVSDKTGIKITKLPLMFWLNGFLMLPQIAISSMFLLMLLNVPNKSPEVFLIAVVPAFILVLIGIYIKQTMYTPIKILSQKYFFTWKDKTFSADY